MSNIMQYLVQLGEEFRDSYQNVDSRMDEVIQTLNLLSNRMVDVEMRLATLPNDKEEEDE